MKTIYPSILLCYAALGLSGCDSDAFDQAANEAQALKAVDGVSLKTVHDHRFHYIVLDKRGNVWEVDCMSCTSPYVSYRAILFPAPAAK